MPYRRAHLWLLLLFPGVALAFWPSYFGKLTSVPWVLHAHGVTASLWVALLALQSWSISRGARALHKVSGRGSLFLFPVFWVSGLLVVRYMAAGFVAKDNPFHATFGARLVPVDSVTSAAVLYLYYLAVSQRRAALVHASAMLAVPLFLLPPILGRLVQIGGPLAIRSADEFYKFGWGLHLSNALAIVIAVALYSRRPRTAWPFLIASGAILLESILFETLGRTAAWEAQMTSLAAVPVSVVAVCGLVLSIAVVALAWFGAARSHPPAARGRVAMPV